MSKPQQKRRNQAKVARLEIVSKLYKRGFSMRQIRAEVMKRLDLSSYSTKTVHDDVHSLLDEWREERIDDMDKALQLELERIDDCVRELWEQWEKSKEDYQRTVIERAGTPSTEAGHQGGIRTNKIKQKDSSIQALGDPSYIAEIRSQLAERRKLLGLYAPEKKDIQGQMSFAAMLMESGMIDDEESGEDEN